MIRGSLEDLSLPNLVRFISMIRKSGRLELEGPAGSGVLSFKNGDLYAVVSTAIPERIGRKMVRRGVLSEAALRSALKIQHRSHALLGEIVMSAGHANRAELVSALQEQVQDGLANVLRLDPAEFHWVTQTAPDNAVTFSTSKTLGAAQETLSEIARVRADVPLDDAQIGMNPVAPDDAAQISLGPSEWSILALLGARRKIGDVLHYSPWGEIETLRVIHRLVNEGLLEIPGPRVAGGKARTGTAESLLRSPASFAPSGDFEIVFVSTADRARGPLAAAVTNQMLNGSGLAARSAGLQELGAAPARPGTVDAAAELGIDLTGHSARRLGRGELRRAGLVVGFERLHVEMAVAEGGAAPERCFTITELAALVDVRGAIDTDGPAERARTSVAAADAARRAASGYPVLEIEDPDPSSPQVQRETVARVRALCRRLCTALVGAHVPPPPPKVTPRKREVASAARGRTGARIAPGFQPPPPPASAPHSHTLNVVKLEPVDNP